MPINTYLMFDGTCEEAFRYYEKHLGGKIGALMRFGDAPSGPEPLPAAWSQKVMHGTITIDDVELFATDAPGRYSKPQGFRLALNVGTESEAERAFKALSDGGEVMMPLTETFFAKRFGQTTDRFGIPWMVLCRSSETAS